MNFGADYRNALCELSFQKIRVCEGVIDTTTETVDKGAVVGALIGVSVVIISVIGGIVGLVVHNVRRRRQEP